MKNILVITSSPRGEASHSSRVAKKLANDLEGHIVLRELWREPLPPIDGHFVEAVFTPKDSRTEKHTAVLAQSDALITELLAADVLILAAGMINFGMPVALKTWIDLITRAGVTFKFTESGPLGLVTGKQVILVLASGGVYSEGPFARYNHLEPAVKDVLGFLGMTEIETVRVEGLNQGPEATAKALEVAERRTQDLVAAIA
jgi:FMN-dependent NADH-azoreductase